MSQSFCSSCGERVQGGRFCGSCGAELRHAAHDPGDVPDQSPGNVADTMVRPINESWKTVSSQQRQAGPHVPPGPKPEQPQRVLPPAVPEASTPPRTPGTGQDLIVKATTALRGNWVGASGVAGLMMLALVVGAVAVALLARPDDLSVRWTLTSIGSLVSAAFGGDLILKTTEDSTSQAASLEAMPLTLTILTSAIGVVAFRRMTAGYRSGYQAIGDAARAAAVVALLVATLSTLSRRSLGGLDDWVRVSGDLEGSVGPSILGGAVLAFLLTFGVLVLSTLDRPWFTGRMALAQVHLRAPLRAAAVVVLLMPLLGFVILIVGLTFGSDVLLGQEIDLTGSSALGMLGVGLAFAGNIGVAGLAFGCLAPLKLVASGELDGLGDVLRDFGAYDLARAAQSESEFETAVRLWNVDEYAAGLWGLVIPSAVVLVAATVFLMRHLPADHLKMTMLVWFGVLLVGLPILVNMSGLSLRMSVEEYGERVAFSGSVGPGVLATTFMMIFFLAVAALAVGAVTGAFDAKHYARMVQNAAQQLQSNPADAAQPGWSNTSNTQHSTEAQHPDRSRMPFGPPQPPPPSPGVQQLPTDPREAGPSPSYWGPQP